MGLLSGFSADVPINFPFTKVDLGVYVTDRNFFARNQGDQTTGPSPITINISDIDPSSDNIPYSLSSGELLFKYSGKVIITYNVSYRNTNGTRSDEKFFLEKDSGSGFNLVEGSEGFVYIRTGNSNNSGSKTVLLTVEKGDIIRLRSQRDNGSNNIAEDGLCSIIINSQKEINRTFLELDAGVYTGPDDENEKVRFFDAGVIDG